MKRITLSLLTLLVAAVGTQAKSWKIGPSSVTGMDFASINAAMESSQVATGDTLYLDQYYAESNAQSVSKKVVIIGTGYDASQTDEQVYAKVENVLNLKANGVVLKSFRILEIDFYNDDCVIDRCNISIVKVMSSTAGINHLYSCWISNRIEGYNESQFSKIDIQNCCLIISWNMEADQIRNFESSIINNNVIIRTTDRYSRGYRYALSNIKNTQITNNIILWTYDENSYDYCLYPDVYAVGSGNSIEHNILSLRSPMSNFPTNKTGYGASSSEIFAQEGSWSNFYKLAEKSVAKGYATDGGEVGCHGGMFGNPAGGRPQYIPYFSKVVVGSRTENGKLPVSVTVKIQDE